MPNPFDYDTAVLRVNGSLMMTELQVYDLGFPTTEVAVFALTQEGRKYVGELDGDGIGKPTLDSDRCAHITTIATWDGIELVDHSDTFTEYFE